MISIKSAFFLTAATLFFLWETTAAVAEHIVVTKTIEQVPSGSLSASLSQTDGFTLTWDEPRTVIKVGTQINIDLEDLGVGCKVTLARTVDIEISPRGSMSKWDRVGFGNITSGEEGSRSPFYDPTYSSNTIGYGLFFRLYGAQGSSQLTLYVMGNPTDGLVVGPFEDSILALDFLTGLTNDYYDRTGIWVQGDTQGVYTVPASEDDNTLFLDVSDWYCDTSVNAAFSTTPVGFYSVDPAELVIGEITNYHTLTVSVNGDGAVVTNPEFIDCPTGYCIGYFPSGSEVKLEPLPEIGYSFGGWSMGECKFSRVCSLIMSKDQKIEARFRPHTILLMLAPVLQAGAGKKTVEGDKPEQEDLKEHCQILIWSAVTPVPDYCDDFKSSTP